MLLETHAILAAQSHRRTIDPAYLAKRVTAFWIERPHSPAAVIDNPVPANKARPSVTDEGAPGDSL